MAKAPAGSTLHGGFALPFAKRQIAPTERPSLRLVASEALPSPEVLSSQVLKVAISTALLLGILVRLAFVLSADFPLNDGGMFYNMATDLQANGYHYIKEAAVYRRPDADPNECCAALRNSLRASPLYAVVLDDDGATVFKRR